MRDLVFDKNDSNLSTPANWLCGFGEVTLPFWICIQRLEVRIVPTSLSYCPDNLRAFAYVFDLLYLWFEELVHSGSKCHVSILYMPTLGTQ